ncbi:nicotinamidase [Trichonephila inaurata madagascariensis]|uniref:nicotinamidase n=1 Tax=Trichonephila inaurata madagascariensis TaxID=2747483 RepID=A0A8X6XQ11_9ARAC|nr:nicotinamidase [Trichonephila inaurata madagascariensis]
MAFFDLSLDFDDVSVKLDCFQFFDENDKKHLDVKDLNRLIASLLNKNAGDSFESLIKDLFATFDRNGDKKIDAVEFEDFWNNWIIPLVKPTTALLIIDVQNDFVDGSLALKHCPAKQDGKEIIQDINELINKIKFDIVVYSLDYHPEDHVSFFENLNRHKLSEDNEKNIEDLKMFDTVSFYGPPKMEQKLWPRHCVSIRTNPKTDSYSAFYDNMKLSQTKLHSELKQKKVTHVFICGLAYDYCVSYTALDSLDLGYATVIVENATRGTDDNMIENMKKKLRSKCCVLASSSELENMIKAKDIRIEFARVLAKS